MPAHAGREAIHPIRAFLRKPVEAVRWDDAPLEDVIEWLRTEADGSVSIVVHWNALADAGVHHDTKVNAELQGTTVAEVLRVVFEMLSDDDPLTYEGTGSVLTISTTSQLDRKRIARVYDLAEIIVRSTSAPGVPSRRIAPISLSTSGTSAYNPPRVGVDWPCEAWCSVRG